jgi:hypothetical protein
MAKIDARAVLDFRRRIVQRVRQGFRRKARIRAAVKGREQRAKPIAMNRLSERDEDGSTAERPKIDAIRKGRAQDFVPARRRLEINADSIEERRVTDSHAQLTQATREHLRIYMDPPRDFPQPIRAMVHGVR